MYEVLCRAEQGEGGRGVGGGASREELTSYLLVAETKTEKAVVQEINKRLTDTPKSFEKASTVEA